MSWNDIFTNDLFSKRRAEPLNDSVEPENQCFEEPEAQPEESGAPAEEAGRLGETEETLSDAHDRDEGSARSYAGERSEVRRRYDGERRPPRSRPDGERRAQPRSERTAERAAESDDVPVGAQNVCELSVCTHIIGLGDAGKAALFLAMSDSIVEERRIKDALASCGWVSVATEVGGLSGDLSLKVSRALVGAALNSGVVQKNTSEMHALMHAAQEAFSSFIPFGLLQTSLGAKIAIVRNSQWIAVAVAGDTAFHSVAHHQRAGLGVMHI